MCIVGEIGSGKSSLLQAIIGDMIYMDDEWIQSVKVEDKKLTGAESYQLHKKLMQVEVKESPIK